MPFSCAHHPILGPRCVGGGWQERRRRRSDGPRGQAGGARQAGMGSGAGGWRGAQSVEEAGPAWSAGLACGRPKRPSCCSLPQTCLWPPSHPRPPASSRCACASCTPTRPPRRARAGMAGRATPSSCRRRLVAQGQQAEGLGCGVGGRSAQVERAEAFLPGQAPTQCAVFRPCVPHRWTRPRGSRRGTARRARCCASRCGRRLPPAAAAAARPPAAAATEAGSRTRSRRRRRARGRWARCSWSRWEGC
jgi:hypothetical protein